MKKFLAIVAIASFAVACNNSSESKPATDSPATAPVVVDSPAVKVDSPAVKVDSPAVKVDSPAVAK